MDTRSFDPNFQSDGFLVYVIQKIGFLPLVRPWGQHPYLVLLAYLWTFRHPFETPSLPFQNPFGFHLPANPAPVVVDQTNQCRNTSNGSKHLDTPRFAGFQKAHFCYCQRPVRNASQGALVCALGFSAFFFPFFVFLDFFLKTVRVRFLVYAIQKEGLPTLVCPWDRHPYLVLSPMCGPFLKDTFWGRRSTTFLFFFRFLVFCGF